MRIDDPVYTNICKLYANTHYSFFIYLDVAPGKISVKNQFSFKGKEKLKHFQKN